MAVFRSKSEVTKSGRASLLAHTRRASSRTSSRSSQATVKISTNVSDLELKLAGRALRLTNLQKPFWPELGITKGGLLQYYADVSAYLLPHLIDRAMVMKRYPNGAAGDFFFQKRAPVPRPEWIETCSIEHASASVIDFPIVRDLASLLWVVNLGCIDLNPWYARCDDVNRPDYLHFDLDPVEGTAFEQVCETALLVHEGLTQLKMPAFAKTTGSRGIHIYVPIVRGPTQKQVWTFAKQFALSMAQVHPKLITAEYRVAKRPKGRCLWITIKTPGVERWLPFIPFVLSLRRQSRHPSRGTKSPLESASRIFAWTMFQTGFAKRATFGDP
jgi:bifunctional non-homologous end joining protein LigD